MGDRQVDKSHYAFSPYMSMARWSSVWHQVNEVLSLNPDRVLEIGPGTGVFKQMLQIFGSGLKVETLDFDAELHPDHVAPATKIPLPDSSFDVVCAFQMLEHLPFDEALVALNEMTRVARTHVVISLPDSRRTWRYLIHLPRIGEKSLLLHRPQMALRSHAFDGEHYWEVNKRGYELDKVLAEFLRSRRLRLRKTFRPFENVYHRFFLFEVNGSTPHSEDQEQT